SSLTWWLTYNIKYHASPEDLTVKMVSICHVEQHVNPKLWLSEIRKELGKGLTKELW
ncbi:12928_t:CDS:2, partial [Dentiscutata heterogama]